MGARVLNFEAVKDYSTQSGCVRFHIDLPLSADQLESFETMMSAQDYSAAFNLLRQSTSPDNEELLSAFETAFMSIDKSQPVGV